MALVKHKAAPAALIATEDFSLRATTTAEQSFVAIFELLVPPLCDFAKRFLSADDAEDAVQVVMCDIWQRWPVLAVEKPPLAYYFRAVRNQIANHRRRAHREKVRLAAYMGRLIRSTRPTMSPDARLELEELAAVIDAAIAGLPERCREVWLLVRENEFRYQQASEAMEVSVATAKTHMSKANELVREAITDAGYHEAIATTRNKLLPRTSAEDSQ